MNPSPFRTRATCRHAVSLLLLALLLPANSLTAQAGPDRSELPGAPYVGVAMGLGAVPSSILSRCPGYSAEEGDPNAAPYAGLFFGLPLGPVHLETRTHRWLGDIAQGCPTLLQIFESGIHTKYTALFDRVPRYGSDLRVRYGLPFQPALVASLGGGWLWGTDVPYVGAGLGYRTTGTDFRFAVDATWQMYRIPFRLSDEEWEDYELVRVVGERKEHDWQRGWSLQVGLARFIR